MDNSMMGKIASMITGVAVLLFAVSMMVGAFVDTFFVSCFFSMFIALGFVPFMAALNATNSDTSQKACGIAAMCFAAIYAVIVFLVYYAACTTVRLDTNLSQEALSIISFGHVGSLFFNYDLLGYAFMALSTFLTGMNLKPHNRGSKCFKTLLMIHGVFFPSCFLVPMFSLFTPGTSSVVGTVLLLIWCMYFFPICVLGYRYFSK